MRKPSKLAEPRLSLRGGGGKLQGVSGLHAKVCSPTEAKRERGKRQFHGIVHGAAIVVQHRHTRYKDAAPFVVSTEEKGAGEKRKS